jgi:integrase
MAGPALLAWARAEERRVEWDVRRQSDVEQLIRRYLWDDREEEEEEEDGKEKEKRKEKGPWGALPLRGITSGEVTALLSRLDDRATTRENLRRVLRRFFRDWPENPVPPVPRRTRRSEEQRDDGDRYRVLSEEEWVRFEAACHESSDPLADCLLVILETGMRSEEARALQYWDFDFGAGTLSIRRVVVRMENPYRLQVVELTKSKFSRREIPLSAIAREVLSSLRYPSAECHEEFGEDGTVRMVPDRSPKPETSALIWSTQPGHGGEGAGRPLDQARLSKTLDRIREQAGIPRLACRDGHPSDLAVEGQCSICGRRVLPLRVHDLRHSHCSYLVAKGIPLPTVRARLGWSPKSNTIFRYAHDTPAASEKTVKALDELADLRDRIAAFDAQTAREENEELPF